jgi:hypothetical protein
MCGSVTYPSVVDPDLALVPQREHRVLERLHLVLEAEFERQRADGLGFVGGMAKVLEHTVLDAESHGQRIEARRSAHRGSPRPPPRFVPPNTREGRTRAFFARIP